MKKNLYDWLNIPQFSSQEHIRSAVENKKRLRATVGAPFTEQETKFFHIIEHLINNQLW